MNIAWTDDLATGIDEIDSQHKDLFQRLNDLLDACSQQKGKEEIGKFLNFLSDYVILHFAAEEREMMKHQYPGIIDHKIEHSKFTLAIGDLKKEFAQQGARIDVVLVAVRTSFEWLQFHIRKTDKALGVFLKAKAAGE